MKGEKIDYEAIARKTCRDIGFISKDVGLDADSMDVIVNVENQSIEIGSSVDDKEKEEDLGAGDQGLMFGYATDEYDQKALHPLPHLLANRLVEKVVQLRHSGEVPWMRPDSKSQVIMEYKKVGVQIKPVRVYNVLISQQHSSDITNEEIREFMIEKVIKEVIPEEFLIDTSYHINPSGSFIQGGPHADAGLTGRKIIVDTYGGWAPHGGGAFSGKDPTKVDRSAAYYARFVAKSLVASKLCNRALVQCSYAIGIAEPLSIHIDTYGTHIEGIDDHDLKELVKKNFDFRPHNIIKELDLLRPIYQKTAVYGHFGRDDPDFTWEIPKILKLEE